MGSIIKKKIYAQCFPEIEKGIKQAPAGSRYTTIDKLLSWHLCEKRLTSNHEHVSKDTMKSACMHLLGKTFRKEKNHNINVCVTGYFITYFLYLDSHRNQFRAALVKEEPKNLDIVLCYELSHACVGVKRRTFQVRF